MRRKHHRASLRCIQIKNAIRESSVLVFVQLVHLINCFTHPAGAVRLHQPQDGPYLGGSRFDITAQPYGEVTAEQQQEAQQKPEKWQKVK